jgi:hypothetical protein
MSSRKQEQPAPTQTTPKGLEISVPKKSDFLANLNKVGRPKK